MFPYFALCLAAFIPLFCPHNEIKGNVQFPTNTSELVSSLNSKADRSEVPAPTEMVVKDSIEWQPNGNAIMVYVATGGTLSANTSGWIEGQAVLAVINLEAGVQIASNIRVIGYTQLPTGKNFICTCLKIGDTIYLNLVTSIE